MTILIQQDIVKLQVTINDTLSLYTVYVCVCVCVCVYVSVCVLVRLRINLIIGCVYVGVGQVPHKGERIGEVANLRSPPKFTLVWLSYHHAYTDVFSVLSN